MGEELRLQVEEGGEELEDDADEDVEWEDVGVRLCVGLRGGN